MQGGGENIKRKREDIQVVQEYQCCKRGHTPSLGQALLSKSSAFKNALSGVCWSTVQTVSQLKTNFIYAVKNSDLVSRKAIVLRKDGSVAWLLGKPYTEQQSYMFEYVYRTTLWFTYRTDVVELDEGSDNGWGCMIRAVQMVMAQTLKRHLTRMHTKVNPPDIINHFHEHRNGVFSLAHLCEVGNIRQRWTSSTEIFAILQQILESSEQFQSLCLQVNGNAVNFTNIQSQQCRKYPAMVAFSTRVGLKNIPQEMHAHYMSLMRHKVWVGGIGGVGGQALYILGGYDDKVIYLDPHLVQSNTMEAHTYFNDTPRGIPLQHLSPSISFCYYFQNKEEHFEWLEWMSEQGEAHYPHLVIDVMTVEAKRRAREKRKIEEDSFQYV